VVVGTVVGITAFATDADATNNAVTYSLTDDAGGLFAIDINSGVVTVAGSLDYEHATSHSITVQAASSDGSLASETFSISLNDVDDTPPSAVVTSITQMVNDSGAAGDFITNDATVDISGTFSGSLGGGESIQVSADNGANWVTATTIIGNVWVATGVALVPGEGTLLITRTIDAANNVTLGASEDYTLDTAALASITLNDITADNVVNIAESAGMVAVTGSVGGEVQDGDTVTLTVNGIAHTGAVSGGIFSIDVASSNLVADPDKTVDASVSTTDTAGNSTTATTTKAYGVDVIAPTAVTTTLVSITDDTGNPGDFITSDGSVTVQGAFSGTLGVGESIQVSANGTNWVNATAAGSIWVASSVNLVPGSGTLTTRTIDAAGNVTPGASHSYVYTTLPVFTGTPNADTLTGSSADEEFYGLSSGDTINALGGNDLLDGGTGNDTMTGGEGDDTYVVDTSGDLIVEVAGQGIDTVRSTASAYTLPTNIEHLTLVGAGNQNGTGNTLANVLTGNSANNTLYAAQGNDTLIGGDGHDYLYGREDNDSLLGGSGNDTLNGGTGVDTMEGGTGNDTYTYDTVGDIILESNGEGIDLVLSNLTYTLGANLENLTLTGTANRNGGGNELPNLLIGNSGNNSLWAAQGNDTLIGGDGHDYLYGREDNDSLLGGSGNDTLNGGAGVDTMEGGTGNDTYTYDTVGDLILESNGEGIDLVLSNLTYTLGANVENLTLTGAVNRQGGGNELANLITGNTGSNLISGYGGADTLAGGLGNDTLSGGTGADSFLFNTALGASNIDTITDFSVIDDLIVLDNAVFTGFGTEGTITSDMFEIGTAALDAEDRLIYDNTNGKLYYDLDGTGGSIAVQIASLTGIPNLAHDDFLIV